MSRHQYVAFVSVGLRTALVAIGVGLLVGAGCAGGASLSGGSTATPTRRANGPAGSAPIFDVTSFGARGDGRADDTTAFRGAFEAAGKAGGGTIHVPTGTFLLQAWTSTSVSPLLVPPGTAVVGAGVNKTTLKLIGSSVQANWQGIGLVQLASHTRLVGLAVDGSRGDIDGARMQLVASSLIRTAENATDITIDDVTVHDGFSQHLEGSAIAVSKGDSNVTLRNIVAFANDGSGVGIGGDITGQRSSNITLDTISAYDNGWQGVTFFAARNISATHITAYGNAHMGINIEWCDAVTISDSQTYDNGRRGLNVFGVSTHISIDSLVAHDNGVSYGPGAEVGLVADTWHASHETESRSASAPTGITQDITFTNCTLTASGSKPDILIQPDVAKTTEGTVVPNSMVFSGPGAGNWTVSYDGKLMSANQAAAYSQQTYHVALKTQPAPAG